MLLANRRNNPVGTDTMQSTLISQTASLPALPSLLVMEPETSQRKGIAVAVLDHVHEMRLTGTMAEAIRCCTAKSFTVALLSLDLAESSSWEALGSFRAVAPTSRIIIAAPQIRDTSRLAHFGVHTVLEQPLDLAGLLAILSDTELSP